MSGNDYRAWTWCPNCEKRGYPSRKAARKVCGQVPGRRMNAYPCTRVDGMFHVGHLPQVVRAGDVTRHEHYSSAA
ncbi:MAG: hypothetical protein JWN03_7395 [Nocardia sp.]|uniref:hypothetical protein n=1 Tax=Nocardia sp. TaxID=1821 RepID=UPI002619B0FD|nr:hypothetical protein [Nocardia sp.]MCU1647120.1 hypothetical protein [Nocardia sp.]